MNPSIALQCKRHDRSQVELRLSYPVSAEACAKSTSVELFFFVPYSLGEASKIFEKEDFYREITNHYFFNTPRLGATASELVESLALTSKNLSRHRSDQLSLLLIRQVKLLSHVIKRRMKRISKWHPDQSSAKSSAMKLRRQCKELTDVLDHFRNAVVLPMMQPEIDNDQAVQTAILNADEYLSLRLENLLTQKLAEIAIEPGFEELAQNLRTALETELGYRISMGSEFFVPSANETDMELYLYRSSLLKKYINQLLYIKLDRSSRGKLYRNIVASFAAALAASWSSILNLSSYRAAGGEDIGFSMFAVLLFGVGAYVTKDRIKEISKEYFNQKLKRYLPDYHVKMTYAASSNDKRTTVGHYDEVLRYLKLEALPESVGFLRNLRSRRDTSIRMDESVILYSKEITIDDRAMAVAFSEVKKIEEVLRFNLNNFLKNLADPWKSLAIFELEKGPLELRAPRVYHLNLIIRVRQLETSLAHYRVILDKNGIKRIESVTGAKPLKC